LWELSVGIEENAKEQHETGTCEYENKKKRSEDGVSKGGDLR
jgi:hypothetical protein